MKLCDLPWLCYQHLYMNWSAGRIYFQNNSAGIYSPSEYQSPQTSRISPLMLEKNVFLHFMLPDCAWFLLICFFELKLRNFNSFFALQKCFIHTKGFYSYKELCRIPLCCSSSVSVGTFFCTLISMSTCFRGRERGPG